MPNREKKPTKITYEKRIQEVESSTGQEKESLVAEKKEAIKTPLQSVAYVMDSMMLSVSESKLADEQKEELQNRLTKLRAELTELNEIIISEKNQREKDSCLMRWAQSLYQSRRMAEKWDILPDEPIQQELTNLWQVVRQHYRDYFHLLILDRVGNAYNSRYHISINTEPGSVDERVVEVFEVGFQRTSNAPKGAGEVLDRARVKRGNKKSVHESKLSSEQSKEPQQEVKPTRAPASELATEQLKLKESYVAALEGIKTEFLKPRFDNLKSVLKKRDLAVNRETIAPYLESIESVISQWLQQFCEIKEKQGIKLDYFPLVLAAVETLMGWTDREEILALQEENKKLKAGISGSKTESVSPEIQKKSTRIRSS